MLKAGVEKTRFRSLEFEIDKNTPQTEARGKTSPPTSVTQKFCFKEGLFNIDKYFSEIRSKDKFKTYSNDDSHPLRFGCKRKDLKNGELDELGLWGAKGH